MHAAGIVFAVGIAAVAIVLAVYVIADAMPSERCQCYGCTSRRQREKKVRR